MRLKNLVLKSIFRKKRQEADQLGFGTFFGVYLPGVLSMFGVIIYLRFGWIIGSLGLFQTLYVVSLSCLILFITVLSISSAATNMQVGGGGSYYMVSRSLGIEIGSAVGVPLLIAQALTISFCAVGFAESIHPYFQNIPLQYLGAITIIILMGIVYTSSSIALNTQFGIFLIILASFISLLLGDKLPLETVSSEVSQNFTIPFWTGFALFFPATTGVESGVSMSGSLRSPRKSLPIGSLAVLATGFIVYITIPFFLWNHAPRALLVSDGLIFQHVAKFQSLIIAGIWAATLSSVISGLLAAPRTLQALAVDGVFPRFLASEWGKTKEPRLATLFCFSIAMLGVFFGSIDKIAPVLTMFYLIAYATLNLATGLEGLLGNPSWRPTFKVHWAVSLSGVVLCLFAMFMIDSGYTIIALLFVVVLFLFMKKRNFVAQWEDIRHGLLVFLSRIAIYKLANKEVPARSWRPNFIVFSDNPTQISHLVNVTSAICKGKGFLTLASVFSSNVLDYERAERWKKMVTNNLNQNNIEALVEFCMDESLLSGAKQLISNYGIGSVSPNTLVIGEIKKNENSYEYIKIIQAAIEAKKNVIIIRDKQAVLKFTDSIHIWWDDFSRQNSELMILLGYMLISNKVFKKATLELNSIVTSEVGKGQRLTYFNDYLKKARFQINTNVFVKEANQSSYQVMNDVSSGANMVLIGMNPPKPNETSEEYEAYYYNLINETSEISNAIFIISSDGMNLSEIFN